MTSFGAVYTFTAPRAAAGAVCELPAAVCAFKARGTNKEKISAAAAILRLNIYGFTP
jgi:hypothetical protein